MPDSREYVVPALKTALFYALFGGLWILLSDKLLGLLTMDLTSYAAAQTFKGWVYIAVTALLIFYLVRRNLRALSRAHEALAVSEHRYSMAADAARAGTWELDISSGDLLLNDHYLRALGYDPATFPPIQASWEALVHPSDKTRVMELLNTHLYGEAGEYTARYRLLTGDGRWQWVMDRGRVFLRGKNNAPLKAIGVQIVLEDADDRDQYPPIIPAA